MKVIKVTDIYRVTQISKTNNEAWEKLIKVMETEQGNVQFDFQDIHLEEPWSNEVFKKLLGNEHVYIKVYSSEKTKDTIELACKIGNMKTGRVTNEDEIMEPTVVEKDKRHEEQIKKFKNNIAIVKDTGMLNALDVVDQIGSFQTVQALEKALTSFSEETGIKKFAVDTELMFIQINIIELIARMIGRLKSKGITCILLSKDRDVAGKISIYQCTEGASKLSPTDKIKLFNETIGRNTVGMLSKFRDTKKLDEFGRKGDGKPIVCRVAIYKGVDKEGNLVFTTFNGKYFYTKLHYALDHDGEILDHLVTEEVRIPINQIGLCDMFLGALYHFNLPIQYNSKDYVASYKQDDDGEIVEKKMTLPEHIGMVLRDFDIKYNGKKLIDAIGQTMRILRDDYNKSHNIQS